MAYTTINKSTDNFNTVTYTGNGASDRAVTSGFATDFVWIKNRGTTDDHVLFDKVRGGTKYLYSNQNAAEATYSSQDVTFESTGVDVGSYQSINQNNGNIVSWHWKGNGTGSANTDGSINSTVSANTTSGFSIVSYTGNGSAGATVGHGLGAIPKMMIIKQYSSNGGTENWTVYHHKLGNTDGIYLNSTASTVGTNTFWNNTTPSSTLFTLGTSDNVNNNTVSYIAYCFAEKNGYSKFGSYTGNGNNDGTFVYTGFAPAFILQKRTANTSDWTLADNKRPGYNEINKRLVPNESAVEATNNAVDFLSNGFKCRQDQSNANASGENYIYMAFASAPLVGTNNIPATAR